MSTVSVKTPLHQAFCDSVKARRKELGLTQLQVAELLGVEQPTYSAIESGKGSPSLDLVERVARALQVHPSDLLKAFTVAKPAIKIRGVIPERRRASK